jgi:hypothetical protein
MERGVGGLFVSFHQPTIADNVGRQDRSKAALHVQLAIISGRPVVCTTPKL